MNLLKAFFRKRGPTGSSESRDTRTSLEPRPQADTPTLDRHLTLRRGRSKKPHTHIDPPSSAMSSMLEKLRISSPITTGPCRLLELPAELRNKIWDYAFTGTTVKLGASTTAPALLFTCKQINSEANGAYWRMSEFKSWKIIEVRDFLARIGPTNLALITNVTYDPAKTGGHPFAARGDTGIAHSAFIAQWDRFWVEDWLRDTGVMLPEAFIIKVPFMAAHGELITSSRPWQEFGELLGDGGGLRRGGGGRSAQQVGHLEMTSQTAGELVRTVAEQSRFFDYEHLDIGKCWTTEWCVKPGYVCGCPAKAVA